MTNIQLGFRRKGSHRILDCWNKIVHVGDLYGHTLSIVQTGASFMTFCLFLLVLQLDPEAAKPGLSYLVTRGSLDVSL